MERVGGVGDFVGFHVLLTLQLVWELLWSDEHGSKTWELHQDGAVICDTFFFVGRRYTRWTDSSAHVFSVWGQCSLSRRAVSEWIEMFKNGCMSVTGSERLSRPATATTAQNEEKLGNWFFKTEEWHSMKLQNNWISALGSAYSVVHDNLQVHKVCVRWVPKELTDEHKCMCLDICSQHLPHYSDGDNFLQQIVTGDETWVQHYQPETKSMQ
jgi:hypothetical protein